jgi:hypothetical protein
MTARCWLRWGLWSFGGRRLGLCRLGSPLLFAAAELLADRRRFQPTAHPRRCGSSPKEWWSRPLPIAHWLRHDRSRDHAVGEGTAGLAGALSAYGGQGDPGRLGTLDAEASSEAETWFAANRQTLSDELTKRAYYLEDPDLAFFIKGDPAFNDYISDRVSGVRLLRRRPFSLGEMGERPSLSWPFMRWEQGLGGRWRAGGGRWRPSRGRWGGVGRASHRRRQCRGV